MIFTGGLVLLPIIIIACLPFGISYRRSSKMHVYVCVY